MKKEYQVGKVRKFKRIYDKLTKVINNGKTNLIIK